MIADIDMLSDEMVQLYIELGICTQLKAKTLRRLSKWDRAVIYAEQIRDKGFRWSADPANDEYMIDKELSWNNSEKPLGV